MKRFITTVFNSKNDTLTTIYVDCNSLSELENIIFRKFNGMGIITAVIITFNTK